MRALFLILCFSCTLLADEDQGFQTHAEGELWPIGFKWPETMVQDWKRAKRMIKSPKADVLV